MRSYMLKSGTATTGANLQANSSSGAHPLKRAQPPTVDLTRDVKKLKMDNGDRCAEDLFSPTSNGNGKQEPHGEPTRKLLSSPLKPTGGEYPFVANPMSEYCMEPFLWQSLQMAKFAASGLLAPNHAQYSSLLSKFPLYSLYDLAAYSNGMGGLKPPMSTSMSFESASYLHLLKAYQQQQQQANIPWPTNLNQAVYNAINSSQQIPTESLLVNTKCPYCTECTFDNEDQYDDHVMGHVSKQQTIYECDQCSSVQFDTKQKLDEHLVVTHSVTIHKCVICEQMFSTKSDVEEHIIGKHGKQNVNYHCVVCNQSWVDECELKLHVKQQHCSGSTGGVPKRSMTPELKNSLSPTKSEQQHKRPSVSPKQKRLSNFGIDSLIRKDVNDDEVVVDQQDKFDSKPTDGDDGAQSTTGVVKCNICDKSLNDVTQLTEHKLKNHFFYLGMLRCGVCNQTLNSVEQFVVHQGGKHDNETNCEKSQTPPMPHTNCIICRQLLPNTDYQYVRLHADKHFSYQSTATLSPNSSTSAYSSETEETPEEQKDLPAASSTLVPPPKESIDDGDQSATPNTYCIEEDSMTSTSESTSTTTDDDEEDGVEQEDIDDDEIVVTDQDNRSYCVGTSNTMLTENKTAVECFH